MYQFLGTKECIEYKVELGNAIQKHILRDYIMNYSNLGANKNECIKYKVEHAGKLVGAWQAMLQLT
jgi:hypothetical protein